jgi:glycosyltransferase involved in cell wall biosynthesis
MTTSITLNAHLLSAQAGYRTAGIHGYIYHLLTHLPAAAPADWRLTALVGARNAHTFDGMAMRRAALDTESPLRRIVWEQALQPFALTDSALYHALAFVAPLALPAPMVTTVYDLSFLHYPQALTAARRVYLRLFTGLTCRRARRVLAISHYTADDVARSLGVPRAQIDVAACGYDAQVFQPLPSEQVADFKQRMGLPARFWLFIGTLEPRKNLTTLIHAYAALPPHQRLPLVIGGGKGWLYDDIFAAVEQHQLGDAVRFIGFVSHEALPFWYNSAEAFLYPSIYEGFGLPVLEAMACGTPTVVADASSLPEVVGMAGLRVPPLDQTAWTDALQRVYHDAAWREQARLQGLSEAQRYSWAETARQTVASYQRALG